MIKQKKIESKDSERGIIMKKTTKKYLEKLNNYSKKHLEKAISISNDDIFAAIRELYHALNCKAIIVNLYNKINRNKKENIVIDYNKLTNIVCLGNIENNEKRIINAYEKYAKLF